MMNNWQKILVNIPIILAVVKKLVDYFEMCWILSADGGPNQGSDPRVFGRGGAFVQWIFSVKTKKVLVNPYRVIFDDGEIFVGVPPYFVANMKLLDGSYLHVRLGWRYDVNWKPGGGWILSAASKFLDRPMVYK